MPVNDTAIHLDPGALNRQLAEDVQAGLTSPEKTLPSKYFYDAHGSDLFDQITKLDEYYPFRAERAVLRAHAADIAAASGAGSLVEIGSGTSEKTRLLLDALHEAGTLRHYVPFDVDPAVLKDAGAAVAEAFPDLQIDPVVGDFERHLDLLPHHPGRLVAFLGSTLGNLDPAQRAAFLGSLRATMTDGDHLLLGTDLAKDPARLVAAYDDAAGVTAAFDKNVLTVVNRDLGADFDPDAFEHVARWNAADSRIEMRLRSGRDQMVTIAELGLEIAFARGEEIRTEISTKFRREEIEGELAAAGLELTEWWTDPDGDFAVSLSRPS